MLGAVPVPGLQPHETPAPSGTQQRRVWPLSGVKVLFIPALLMLPLLLWVGRCFGLCKV